MRKIKLYKLPSIYQAEINYSMGLNYAFMKNDSCHYYFNKAITIAKESKDTMRLAHYMRNYADLLSEQLKVEESNELMNEVFDIVPQWKKATSMQLTFAENYLHLGNAAKAEQYLDEVSKNIMSIENVNGKDFNLRNRLYTLRCVANYGLNKKFSTTAMGRFNDSVLNDIKDKQNTIQQQLESRINLQNKNYGLTIERERMRWSLILVILLLVSGTISTLYYINKRRERLTAAQERIETLTKLLDDANKDDAQNGGEAFFKKILLQQLGLIKMVATSPTAQNQEMLHKISSITNDKIPKEEMLVWDDLYPVIDNIYNGFYSHTKSKFGEILNEKEIMLCCLLCAEFSTKEISVVTQQSVYTIYMRKTSIRKKLNMPEMQDIVEYIKGA